MLTRKHLQLPAMAAAVLAAGVLMPPAYASDARAKTVGDAGLRAIGDPNQRAIGDPNIRAIGDPKNRLQKVPPPVGPDIRRTNLRPRGERGIIIWMRNKTKGERGNIINYKRPRPK